MTEASDNKVLTTYSEMLDKEILGYVLAVIGAACLVGPSTAYILGWANMPLFVAIVVTIFSAPFGIILVMISWVVFTTSTCCTFDKNSGILTIKMSSNVGPLGKLVPANILNAISGLNLAKKDGCEEMTYPLNSLKAVVLEKQVTRARSSKHGGGRHITYVIKLRQADETCLSIDQTKTKDEGQAKAELVANFLEIELEEIS